MSQGRDLTRKAALNSGARGVVYLVYLLAMFVSNKVLVEALGTVVFGVWQVCFRLMSYVTPGEGPVAQALKWIIANRSGVGDQKLRRYVGAALVTWGTLSSVVLVLGLVFAWFSPRFINDLPLELVTLVRLTCVILLVRLIVATGSRLFLAPVQGMNAMYRATLPNILIEVAKAVLLVTTARLGFGLVGLAVSMLLVAILAAGLYMNLVRRTVPWFGVARPDRDDLREVSAFGGWLMVWNVLTRVLFMSDVILLGLVTGAAEVTVLTFTQYMANVGILVATIIGNAVAPGLGQLVGGNEQERATRAYRDLQSVTWLVIAIFGTGILLWNGTVVNLWVGAQHFAGPLANALVALLFVQTTLIRIDGIVIDVSLKVREKVLWGSGATIVTVVTALWWGARWGLVGVLAGLVVGRGLLSVVYPGLALRAIGGVSAVWTDVVRRLLVAGLLGVAAAFMGSRLGAVDAVTFLVAAPLAAVFTLVVAWFGGVDGPTRQRVTVRIATLLQGKFGRRGD